MMDIRNVGGDGNGVAGISPVAGQSRRSALSVYAMEIGRYSRRPGTGPGVFHCET